MKVKEIPVSIYKSILLSLLSSKKLKSTNVEDIDVLVSLTSIPSRLDKVHLVVRSILNQNIRPKKILLWLNESLKNEITHELRILEGSIFEIRYSTLTCSHRKLIHTLEAYPNNIIVTCDDDLLYDSDWLKLLYQEHLQNPNVIIANQSRYIRYDENGDLLPYKKWVYDENVSFCRNAIIPVGAGGILYPPGALSKKIQNVDLFLKLTPKADDIWFKAMALLKQTVSIEAKNKPKTPIPILGSQKQSLKKTNIGQDKNREQWAAVSAYFNIDIVNKS